MVWLLLFNERYKKSNEWILIILINIEYLCNALYKFANNSVNTAINGFDIVGVDSWASFRGFASV